MDIFNKIINNMHASKKRHNCVGGGGTHHSSLRWICCIPSAGRVAHGVWMAPMRLVGEPPRHKQWYGPKLPATMVCWKRVLSLDPSPKKLSSAAWRSTVWYSSTYVHQRNRVILCTCTTLAVKNMLAPKTNVFVITNIFAFMSCLSTKLVYLR